VIIGLAVGIGLVTLFSVYFAGDFTKFNERVTSAQIPIILMPSSAACGPCLDNFQPQTVKVVIGVNNTVRWVNNDIFPAMIEADNKNDPLFYTLTEDFKLIKVGESFEFTFTKPGEFGYHGKPWQRGSVIVLQQSR
jgi:hypothetical protein